jgi:nitrite reductase/ring-hydroxylating ferredoxin subunit
MDWSQLHNQQQRVGLVHASANITAVSLYSASLVARAQGRQGAGKVLAYLGLGVVSFGGFLGGHLSYRQAAGVNHSEDVPHRFPSGWQALAPLEDLPDGKLHQRTVAGMPLLVFREGAAVNVLSDVCSHLSGPLHEGKLKGTGPAAGQAGGSGDRDDRGEPCVVCPWHGSTFSLRSGEVQAGPATAKQPRFETRVTSGLVEVNLPGAD